MKVTPQLDYQLFIECPLCYMRFDQVENDDGEANDKINLALFNNKWHEIDGIEIDCPYCDKEFELGTPEY